ncbi:MAG: CHASE2 domain-containing protein, partial [Leptolyngbya sp. SIO4C5]|nr:CHASE2 domain-containing protein [Leptolyngbya sp. SIO4C5]
FHLNHYARQLDVHEALLEARRYLQSEKHLTYPSAYLVPSLFRHPDGELLAIAPQDWKSKLQRWLPGRRQAAAIASVAVLSLIPGVQKSLLGGRLLTQAVYRQVTQQLPAAQLPPVVLVQIDNESVRKSPLLGQPNPINRQYLGDLLAALVELDAQVIGIDYLLDRQQPEDAYLTARLQTAVDQSAPWLIFGSIWQEGQEVGVNTEIAGPSWSLQGYAEAIKWHLVLPWEPGSCADSCPFTYLMALAQLYHQTTEPAQQIQPARQRQEDLKTDLLEAIAAQPENESLQALYHLQYSRLALLSYWLYQPWFQPIVDFSIPPDRVFTPISAYEVLASPQQVAARIEGEQQVVLVGAGGYGSAGGDDWSDVSAVPLAIAYWRQQFPDWAGSKYFTGSEGNAYMVHHLRRNHWVIPIPDLGIIGLAAIAGAGIAQVWPPHRWGLLALATATAGYSLVCLQLFVTANLVWPWLLPSITVWIYLLPNLRKRYD